MSANELEALELVIDQQDNIIAQLRAKLEQAHLDTNKNYALLEKCRAERDCAQYEREKLRELGNQMYRSIVYTSGVPLDYAAQEWEKFRADTQPARVERDAGNGE